MEVCSKQLTNEWMNEFLWSILTTYCLPSMSWKIQTQVRGGPWPQRTIHWMIVMHHKCLSSHSQFHPAPVPHKLQVGIHALHPFVKHLLCTQKVEPQRGKTWFLHLRISQTAGARGLAGRRRGQKSTYVSITCVTYGQWWGFFELSEGT